MQPGWQILSAGDHLIGTHIHAPDEAVSAVLSHDPAGWEFFVCPRCGAQIATGRRKDVEGEQRAPPRGQAPFLE